MLLNLTVRNNTFHLFNNYIWNEDFFWCLVVQKNFKWFKVPALVTASKFSMEANARMLYKSNNNQLPFGCHAWERYDVEFWKPFIMQTDLKSGEN